MIILSFLKQYYQASQFKPGFLGCFINPAYFTRKRLYNSISRNAYQMSGKMLDFGCGLRPYQNLMLVDEYLGLDIEVSGADVKHKNADVYYDGKTLPLESNKFDSVFSTEVFEHVFNISEVLSEINRVLKVDGKLMLMIPFCWPEHEIPYDFARYTSFGIKDLLNKHGFSILSLEKTGSFIEMIFQMILIYIAQSLIPRNIYVALLMKILILGPIVCVGMLLNKVLPTNSNYYLNNVVVAVKRQDL